MPDVSLKTLCSIVYKDANIYTMRKARVFRGYSLYSLDYDIKANYIFQWDSLFILYQKGMSLCLERETDETLFHSTNREDGIVRVFREEICHTLASTI